MAGAWRLEDTRERAYVPATRIFDVDAPIYFACCRFSFRTTWSKRAMSLRMNAA
jgi:hypothetical protein